jgi:CDP-diacylglycerol--glycerol-3-phosphate 3-phosphatidyltransferase
MANWITISRFPLLVGFVLLLYLGGPTVRLAGVPILFILLMLDTVDGVVARARRETSLLGSVLDIAADRAYELTLWVCFADLRVIPLAIPLIVILRTTLTDALRSIGVGQGTRALDQHRSALGRFIVGSSWMRTGYSTAKITAFCGLVLGIALASYPAGSRLHQASGTILQIFYWIAWLAAAICVVRGLPVIFGSIRRAVERASGPEAPDPS